MDPIINAHPKIKRNKPCPCGSGVKFKNCHRLALKVGAAFVREGTRSTIADLRDKVKEHVAAKHVERVVTAFTEQAK